MIKVTKHGDAYQRGPIRCEFCGCEFQYSNSDIRCLDFYYTDDWGQMEREEDSGIACPECGKNIKVRREES